MESVMNRFLKGIIQGLGIVIVLLLFSIFIAGLGVYVLKPQSDFTSKYILCPSIKTPAMQVPPKSVTIEQLLAEGKIIPANEITNSIIGYYNSLITILVTLLGLNAVIAYFYIKGTTEDKVEEKVAKTVQIIFKSQEFHNKLEQQMVKVAEDKVTEHETRIGNLEEKVEAIENKFPIDIELNNGCAKH